MHNFTLEDLLRYMYNETSPSQTAEIKAALESDWSLREKFEVLTSAHKRLDALKVSPSQQSISAILSYAERSVEELSPQV